MRPASPLSDSATPSTGVNIRKKKEQGAEADVLCRLRCITAVKAPHQIIEGHQAALGYGARFCRDKCEKVRKCPRRLDLWD